MDIHHDFSANDCSELVKWGILSRKGIFNNKLKRSPCLRLLLTLLENGKDLEQQKNYGLLYSLNILEKIKVPQQRLVLTGIIIKGVQKVESRTVWLTKWICPLQFE